MLEKLEFGNAIINEELEDDLFYNKVATVHPGRLESIGFCTELSATSDSIKKLNLLLTFVLQSCPYLQQFILTAIEISARGGIYLDFTRNYHLQQIKLDTMHFSTNLESIGEMLMIKLCEVISYWNKRQNIHSLWLWLGMTLTMIWTYN